jgi:hypothetical protein
MTIDEELRRLYNLSSLINLRIHFLTKGDNNYNEKLVEYIVQLITETENVRKELLISPLRKREVVAARMLCQYFIKKYTTLTLEQIGLYFGGRDHATIIHAIKTIEDGVSIKRTDLNNFELYDARIRNYRDTVIAKTRIVSTGTHEEIFSGEYINSLLDIGTRTTN